MVSNADWRDLPCGMVPSARQCAMLDWLQAERPAEFDELRDLLHAALRDMDASHPAYSALDRRYDELYTAWDAVGQPDPRGEMDEGNRAWRTRMANETNTKTVHQRAGGGAVFAPYYRLRYLGATV